jgi:hypothetical protein
MRKLELGPLAIIAKIANRQMARRIAFAMRGAMRIAVSLFFIIALLMNFGLKWLMVRYRVSANRLHVDN